MQTTVVNPAVGAEDAEQRRRRQALLATCGLLDGQPEPALDDLVELAATLCETPIAAVNLLGEEQQLFIAERGLGVAEIPLALSFCQHLHDAREARQIEDLSQDPRFTDNPLVTDPAGLRFYAGAPLRTAEGVFLGTLCVLDWQPRELNAARLSGLERLARQVLRLFETRLQAASPARHSTLDETHYRALMDVNPHLMAAIRKVGSQEALAAALGCAQQHVSKLLKRQRRITGELALKIEAVTDRDVKASDLRPDLPWATVAA